jgi:hypothetical protein
VSIWLTEVSVVIFVESVLVLSVLVSLSLQAVIKAAIVRIANNFFIFIFLMFNGRKITDIMKEANF